MRTLFFVLVLISSCTSGQEKVNVSNQNLTKDQIIKRFLENGAWRVRFFSPEYQLYIDSAIAIDPTIAYLHQQKAMPYFKQGKYEIGLTSLNKAVELDPKSYIDYQAFIKCIFEKSYKESIKDFEKAKQIKGQNGVVMDHSYNFYIGLCYLQLNDFSKSLIFINKSIEQTRTVNGEDWVHYLELFYAGIVNQELGRNKESILLFDKALKEYSTFSDAKYYKALSLFRMNQIELAEKTLADCETDFKRGYTINEDNAIYEKYPYQIKQFYIDMLRLTKK
jgi:tetratricopeptide (TPR) repeat protein